MKDLVWLDARDALTLHDRMLALHGGAAGVHDDGLLQSALARAQQHYAYSDTPDLIDSDTPDLIEMATAYTAGIVRNHPFVDGNKRTGFVVGILFLELNGYRFTATQERAAQAVIALAAGTLDEEGYTSFLRANTESESGRR